MKSLRKLTVGAAIIGTTLTGGAAGALLLGGTANAQTDSSSTSTTAPATSAPAADPSRPARPAAGPHDPSLGGHVANGITATLLTGDTADKVTAAAKAAVTDGTIQRVETDAEGALYEAHMVKADGSLVTVKVAADFSVSSVEAGMK
jgi:hypothetical protein